MNGSNRNRDTNNRRLETVEQELRTLKQRMIDDTEQIESLKEKLREKELKEI